MTIIFRWPVSRHDALGTVPVQPPAPVRLPARPGLGEIKASRRVPVRAIRGD